MKKFGYTIAETLITLAIIGVIGALTLPTFVSRHRNQTNAAALSVAISNLENGLTIYMTKEGKSKMRDTQAGTVGYITDAKAKEYISLLSETISLEFVDKTVISFYKDLTLKNISGENITTQQAIGSGYKIFRAKNGAIYFIKNLAKKTYSESDVIRLGGNIPGPYAHLYIDINGTQMPNTIGRDIFSFIIGEDGILYPFGGIDHWIWINNSSLASKEEAKTWKDPDYDYSCTNETKGKNGLGCTARLIDENFKPTY